MEESLAEADGSIDYAVLEQLREAAALLSDRSVLLQCRCRIVCLCMYVCFIACLVTFVTVFHVCKKGERIVCVSSKH